MEARRKQRLGVNVAICMGLILMLGGDVRAQPTSDVDSVITRADVEELARFDEATSLAADPAGRLYVTDAGADVVVQLSAAGIVQERMGGPGAQAGEFDGPADVDPTNGLAMFVADVGNGRVQHFARPFRFLESIPVGGEAAGGRSSYDRASDTFAGAVGRPVAVASSNSGELYVIDAAAGHVVRWSEARRTQHVIGGFDAGPGALGEPVALAIGLEGRLYVADRTRAAVLVYDAFGSFITTIADGQAGDVRHLLVVGGALWLVQRGDVQVYDAQGALERRWTVRLEAPLVDVARSRGATYLLTIEALYRLKHSVETGKDNR